MRLFQDLMKLGGNVEVGLLAVLIGGALILALI